MSDLLIRDLTAADVTGCDAVIASLPTFFGDPDGIREYREAVRSQQGVVAVRGGMVAGFVTLLFHFPESAEVTWMAVHAEHRRGGIGRRLMDAAAERAAAQGARMLSVLTLGPSVPEQHADNYGGTRAFYRAMGFVPLRELGLRSWNNAAALILARPLSR